MRVLMVWVVVSGCGFGGLGWMGIGGLIGVAGAG